MDECLTNASFPALRFRSSVTVSPFQKYARITFILKNSVACVKNNVLRFCKFAVSVQAESSSIFSVAVASRPGAPPTRKHGKLVRQPTGLARLLTIRHDHSLLYCCTRHRKSEMATALRNGSTDTVLRKQLRKRIRMN